MIRLLSLAQSLNAETGILGNELVLQGTTSGLEVRIPVGEAALSQVSTLVRTESEVTSRLPPEPDEPYAPEQPPQQGMRVTTDDLVGQRPVAHEQYEQTDPRGLPNEYDQFGEDNEDAIELAAIGEI